MTIQVRKFLDLALDQVEFKLDEGGPIGTFEGYASRFGSIDSHGDTIIKGAFASSLRIHGKPKMFFNHDWKMPIGKFDVVKEDEAGLFVRGQLTPGHGQAADIHAALKHGTMDGLSIGGFVKKADVTDKEDGKGQIINRFTRLIDVSIVPFPADGGARVDTQTVRAEDFDVMTEIVKAESTRDVEHFLRDAGFTKTEALAIVSRFKSIFAVAGDPPSEKKDDSLNAEFLARFGRIGRLAF